MPLTEDTSAVIRPDGTVFWSDRRARPQFAEAVPPRCDVLVIGAGYTGLWSALKLLDREPALQVCVVDAARVGDGASGRNGGWVEPSLTHGVETGQRLFAGEIEELESIARDAIEEFAGLAGAGIDCAYRAVGTMECAVAPHQLAGLHALAEAYGRNGWPVEMLDTDAVRNYLRSPRPLAAVRAPTRGGLLDPFALVIGLAAAAQKRGVTIVEHRRIAALTRTGTGVTAKTAEGQRLRAERVVLAVDGGVRQLHRSTRLRTIPLEDYVMVSEPLSAARRASLGWEREEGVSDVSGEFTSLRLTADDRIYWGGSEAVYRFGSRRPSRYEPQRWQRLADDAAAWFPQLGDLAWTHRWTGTVPMTSTGVPTFGHALGGRVNYVFGYTGLGVLASAVAADVLAARALDASSRAGQLAWARRRSLPFPPEPLRWVAVEAARHDIARADRTGSASLYLQTLDRLGVGFTS